MRRPVSAARRRSGGGRRYLPGIAALPGNKSRLLKNFAKGSLKWKFPYSGLDNVGHRLVAVEVNPSIFHGLTTINGENSETPLLITTKLSLPGPNGWLSTNRSKSPSKSQS